MPVYIVNVYLLFLASMTISSPANHPMTLKRKLLKAIDTAMNKLFTPPKLRILILAQLKSFYHNMPIETICPEQIERCEITSSIAP